MKSFKKFNGSQGGFDRGNRQDFNRKPAFNKFSKGKNNYSQDKEMFTTTCASCEASCQVPFRPNGQKPVYCKNCFDGQEKGGNNFKPSFDRKKFGGHDSYRAPSEPRNDNRTDQLQKQIEALGSKLDKVIDLIKNIQTQTVDTTPFETISKEATKALKEASVKKPTTKKVAKKVATKKKK